MRSAVVVGVVVVGRGSGTVQRASGISAAPLHALLSDGQPVNLHEFAAAPWPNLGVVAAGGLDRAAQARQVTSER